MPLQLTFKDGTVQTVPFDSSSTLSVEVTIVDQERESRQRVLTWSEIVDVALVAEPDGFDKTAAVAEALAAPVDAATSGRQKPRAAKAA